MLWVIHLNPNTLLATSQQPLKTHFLWYFWFSHINKQGTRSPCDTDLFSINFGTKMIKIQEVENEKKNVFKQTSLSHTRMGQDRMQWTGEGWDLVYRQSRSPRVDWESGNMNFGSHSTPVSCCDILDLSLLFFRCPALGCWAPGLAPLLCDSMNLFLGFWRVNGWSRDSLELLLFTFSASSIV